MRYIHIQYAWVVKPVNVASLDVYILYAYLYTEILNHHRLIYRVFRGVSFCVIKPLSNVQIRFFFRGQYLKH